jgi:DNA-binding NtrC family response regulator
MPDEYNKAMNLSRPILLCHQNEDFRTLLREMLTKYGFFHVMEANSINDVTERDFHSHFVIVEGKNVPSALAGRKDFLAVTNAEDPSALSQVARFGTTHFISFPFSSQKLVSKLNDLF